MCNLYSITTNQAAIAELFRVANRYVGNLPPMPGVFPDYPAPVVRNAGNDRELTMMRWGMPPPPRAGGYALRQNLGPVSCSFSAATTLAHIARAAVAIQIARSDSILEETDVQSDASKLAIYVHARPVQSVERL
jgi:hypothetical protein